MSRSRRSPWGLLFAPALAVGLLAAVMGCDRAPIRQPAGDAGGSAGSSSGLGGAGTGAGGAAGAGNAANGSDAAVDGPAVYPTERLGAPCTDSRACLSGFCVDGVCCATACREGCRTCAATGSEGTCVNRAWGSAPASPSACAPSAVATCGLDGTCDGLGQCRFHQSGTVCAPGACNGDTVVGAQVCDGAGACKPGATVICTPYGCDSKTATCRSSCTVDTDCVAPRVCTNGSCGGLELGRPCSQDAQCRSGFCVDGVCCNTVCSGTCRSCALAGTVGRCVPVAAGSADPHRICIDQGPATCGRTGLCDGSGACSAYPAGTVCLQEGCSGNNKWNSSTCNGAGSCVAPSEGPSNCAPFRCDSQSKKCLTGCSADSDCVSSDYYCNPSGTCLPKKVIGACTESRECATGFCVGGACCATACTGPCMTCSLAAAPGKCLPIPAGTTAPSGACPPEPPCGNVGTCDGNGGCQQAPAGVACGASRCSSGIVTTAATCNGLGSCSVGVTYACFPYLCRPGGETCNDSCAGPQDCASPATCLNSRCGTSPFGTCTADNECNSGHCAQGVCCATACAGPCASCALPGTIGTCLPVPNPDPAWACGG